MKRRTLDIMFSTGAIVLAVLLAVAGFIMANRASFARDYVADRLAEERITFPEAKDLSARDKAFTESRTGCVVRFAGQAITTGKQAECYANEYIGSHLSYLATRLGMTSVAYVDGMNYRELGAEQGKIRTAITAAQSAKDPKLPSLEKQLADVTTVRTKMFEGTMLRNALLTSYGFGSLGEMASTGARVAFAVAIVLALLAIAGYVHAYMTPKNATFAAPEPVEVTIPDRVLTKA